MCKGIEVNAVWFISRTEKSVHCHSDIIGRSLPLYIVCSLMGKSCFIYLLMYFTVSHKMVLSVVNLKNTLIVGVYLITLESVYKIFILES
jgi:hypothetical protein